MKNLLVNLIINTFKFSKRKNKNKMEQNHPYTYVIVRTDIPLHQQLVQSAHASHYAGFRTKEPEEICSLISLQVANEWELFQAYRNLAMNGIKVIPFFEPDHDSGLTAIATEPLFTKAQREPLFKYKLWASPFDGPMLAITTESLSENPNNALGEVRR